MNFLITAGPTHEPLDPVRYLSNHSSGKMGYALAEAAAIAGHHVVLVSGPVSIAPPEQVKTKRVVTSDDMFSAVRECAVGMDVIVMAAAVADFKPLHYRKAKIKKDELAVESGVYRLELVKTQDILASIRQVLPNAFLVGFAAETDRLEQNAIKKLRDKRCDLIICNDVSRSDIGFRSDYNEVTLYFQDGRREPLARCKKTELARQLVHMLALEAKKKWQRTKLE